MYVRKHSEWILQTMCIRMHSIFVQGLESGARCRLFALSLSALELQVEALTSSEVKMLGSLALLADFKCRAPGHQLASAHCRVWRLLIL